MKNNIDDINGWLYHRIRMCIWKQWKLPRTKKRTPDKWRDFFREEDSLLCALDRTFDAAIVYLMKGESYRGHNLKTYSIEISDPTE